MKKIKILVTLMLVFGFSLNVYGLEYQTKELVAVGDSATVKTEYFDYTDITYVPVVEGREYGEFQFGIIKNNMEKTLPVSINLLVFNKDKKNIGFVTYCTDKDYSSSYAQFKLRKNQTTPLTINANEKYFVDGGTSADVSYFAVLDENKYCQIGGYTKYAGLTIEQISDGEVVSSKGSSNIVNPADLLSSLALGTIVLTFVLIICGYVVSGMVLNALYKRMYATTSTLAYLPIGNNYVALKLAFGDMIAKYYIIAFFVSIPLSFIFVGKILLYILSFVSGVAFIIDVVKLITKKYDLLMIAPITHNNLDSIYASNEGNSIDINASYVNTDIVDKEESNNSTFVSMGSGQASSESSSFLSQGSGQEMIDLNYESSNVEGELPAELQTNSSAYFDTSDPFLSSGENINTNTTDTKSEKQSNNEGESDLANFFR